MRAIASITGLLAMLFIGGTVGGLIFGAPEIWGTSLVLLGLDAIIGMTAQYFADQKDAQFIRELAMIAKEVEEEEKAWAQKEAREEEMEDEEEVEILSRDVFEEDFFDPTSAEIQTILDILDKERNADKRKNADSADLLKRHKEHYERLKGFGDGGHFIGNVEQDPSGAFLFELCASMSYAPRRSDIYNARGVLAIEIADAPTIWYALRPMSGAAIQYVSIFLVRLGEKIRFFSMEKSALSLFLCEFSDGRHVNYGNTSIIECRERIAEILRGRE